MDMKTFISSNQVDFSSNTIDVKMLGTVETAVGVKFGDELTEYVLKYGYLGFEFVELYGVNSRQRLDSDMIKQTIYLHKYFPKTNHYVAIENQGDGDYYLVDGKDYVFEFDTSQKEIINTNMKLFSYILQRFETVKSLQK